MSVVILIPGWNYIIDNKLTPAYFFNGETYNPITLASGFESEITTTGTTDVTFDVVREWASQPILLATEHAGAIVTGSPSGEITIEKLGSTNTLDSNIIMGLPLTIPQIIDQRLESHPVQPQKINPESADLLASLAQHKFTLNEYLGQTPVAEETNWKKIKFEGVNAAFDRGDVTDFGVTPQFTDQSAYDRSNVLFHYTDRQGERYATIVKYDPRVNQIFPPMKISL